MNVWDIILICLMTAAVLWFAVFSVITGVKAKRAGIIRVRFPANTKAFVCNIICFALWIIIIVAEAGQCVEIKKEMDDLQRLGFTQFHMEYYGLGFKYPVSLETEQSATEKLLSEKREKYDRERNLMELRVLCAVGFAVAALFNGAYITKKGVYMFGDTKPKSTAAVIEDGALCFKSDGKPDCTILKLRASEENLRLYSEFIVKKPPVWELRTEQI